MENSKQRAESGEYIAPGRTSGSGQAKNFAKGFWQTAHLREKAVIVLGVLYVLSPLDLIPEVILGPLGLLDDGGAMLAVFMTILGVLKRQRGVRGRTEP